jgi:hypothetical protein
MADVIRLLPDGTQGRFDDSQPREEQNALIEKDFPGYRVLPDDSYGRFDESQSNEEVTEAVKKDFPDYEPNTIIEGDDTSLLNTFMNAAASNFGGEAYATYMASVEALQGNVDFQTAYKDYQKEFDKSVRAYKKQNPGKGLTAEIAGTLTTLPLVVLKGAKLATYLPKIWKSLPNIVKASIGSGVVGGTWGLGEDESRIESGKSGFLWGLGTGAVSYPLLNKVSQFWFKRAKSSPSVESFRQSRDTLYKQVDEELGKIFQPGDISTVLGLTRNKLSKTDVNYDPKLDTFTTSKLKDLEDLVTGQKSFTLSEFENLRRSVYRRYNTSKEEGLLEIIDAMDEVLDSFPTASKLVGSARESHKRYKRAETLEIYLNKAAQKKGNVEDNYRKAIQDILSKSSTKKNFTRQQIETMQTFVNDKNNRFWSKQLAQYSPDANSFMKFLHFYSATMNPATLAFTAASIAAKKSERTAAEKGAQTIKESISPDFVGDRVPNAVVGSTLVGGAAAREEEELEPYRERYIPGVPF